MTAARLLALAACLLGSGALPAGAAAPPPAPECVLTLANGDSLRGTLVSMAQGRLAFTPAVAPDARMQIELKKVDRLVFRERPKAAERPGETLTLRDGSLLHGRFVRLTPEALHFALEGSAEPLALPRAALDTLVAAQEAGGGPGAPPDPSLHVVVLKGGTVLMGEVAQVGGAPPRARPAPRPAPAGDGEEWVEEPDPAQLEALGRARVAEAVLEVRGGAVQARFRTQAVASIVFPQAAESEQERKESEERLQCIVTTQQGTRLTGLDPTLEEGRVALTIVGGHRVRLAVERVVELAFTTTGDVALRRAVLAWGALADRDEEFVRTLAILKEGLGSGWRITEDFSTDFQGSFRRELGRVGVLLIPEMERWDSSPETAQLGAQLKPLVADFLRRGGNVVLLGVTGNQVGFLGQAGLLEVQVASSSSSSQVPFTAEARRFAQGLGEGFQTTNSTQFYTVAAEGKAQAWAGTPAGAPIVARRAGRGWVILMGMDYYESNEQTKQLLVRALTYR